MTYTVTIPLEVVNATHAGGYFELYVKRRQEGLNSKEAWSAVESELESYGLPGRYSSYESFRVRLSSMSRVLKAWRLQMQVVTEVNP